MSEIAFLFAIVMSGLGNLQAGKFIRCGRSRSLSLSIAAEGLKKKFDIRWNTISSSLTHSFFWGSLPSGVPRSYFCPLKLQQQWGRGNWVRWKRLRLTCECYRLEFQSLQLSELAGSRYEKIADLLFYRPNLQQKIRRDPK